MPVMGTAAAADMAGTVPTMALPCLLYLPVPLPSGSGWHPDSRTGPARSLQMVQTVQMDTHIRAEAAHRTAAPATASAARYTAPVRL